MTQACKPFFIVICIAATAGAQDAFQPLEDGSIAAFPESQAADDEWGADDEVYELDALEVCSDGGGDPSLLARGFDRGDSSLLFSTGSASRLSGLTLQRALRSTLGETLAGEPGVSASSYSPGASRPIIRGLEGVRVVTLLDGLGTLDLSQDSPDHGVLIDPGLAEAVEIFRGPSSLRYGSGAIGGAVNTVSRLRPTLVPEGDTGVEVRAGYDSQGSGTHHGVRVKAAEGKWAVSAYSSRRESGDISIPGNAWTQRYIDLDPPKVVSFATGVTLLENPRGTLPNSFHNAETRAVGVTYGVPDELEIGVSVSQFESEYGIPYFFDGTATGRPFGVSSIDTELTRFDAEVDYFPSGGWGPFSRLVFRLASGKYDHAENFEGRDLNGISLDAGTNFTSVAFERDTTEARFELHNGEEESRWRGVSGVHLSNSKLESRRVVLQVPGTDDATLRQESTGIYSTQQLQWGDLTLDFGLRGEFSDVSSKTASRVGESTRTLSQALALGWERADVAGLDSLGVKFTTSLTNRAPTAIERYAFWSNEALGVNLIGGDLGAVFLPDLDGPLDNESAQHFELSITADWGLGNTTLTGYQTDFDNFTFLELRPNLGFEPTAVYVQREAVIRGIESVTSFALWEGAGAGHELELQVSGDWLMGRDRTRRQELPRMPAPKVGSTLIYRMPDWEFFLELRRSFGSGSTPQRPIPEFSTAPYTLLNAGVYWTPAWAEDDLQVSLRGLNLLDSEIREHTSFRKETSPQPGRGFTAEVTWRF